MEVRSTWDLFSQAKDELRALHLLALRLAENPVNSVRVFAENPGSFGALSAKLDDTLWIQPIATYELWRTKLAEVSAPATNVVRLSGAALPSRYLERAAYGAKNQRKIINIWPLGSPSDAGHFSAVQSPSDLIQIDVVADTEEGGLGVIKSPRAGADMRQRWKSNGGPCAASMNVMGLKDLWTPDTVVTLIWGVRVSEPEKLARAMAFSLGRPQLLLIGTSESSTQLAGDSGSLICVRSAQGSTTSRIVSRVAWGQLDELVWCSDLAFTSHRDMAHRCLESACPMIWLGEDQGLLAWYLQSAAAYWRGQARGAVNLIGKPKTLIPGMIWFAMQQEVLSALALDVAQKLIKAQAMQDFIANVDEQFKELTTRFARENASLENANTVPMGIDA
jgi:hypothetical protein